MDGLDYDFDPSFFDVDFEFGEDTGVDYMTLEYMAEKNISVGNMEKVWIHLAKDEEIDKFYKTLNFEDILSILATEDGQQKIEEGIDTYLFQPLIDTGHVITEFDPDYIRFLREEDGTIIPIIIDKMRKEILFNIDDRNLEINKNLGRVSMKYILSQSLGIFEGSETECQARFGKFFKALDYSAVEIKGIDIFKKWKGSVERFNVKYGYETTSCPKKGKVARSRKGRNDDRGYPSERGTKFESDPEYTPEVEENEGYVFSSKRKPQDDGNASTSSKKRAPSRGAGGKGNGNGHGNRKTRASSRGADKNSNSNGNGNGHSETRAPSRGASGNGNGNGNGHSETRAPSRGASGNGNGNGNGHGNGHGNSETRAPPVGDVQFRLVSSKKIQNGEKAASYYVLPLGASTEYMGKLASDYITSNGTIDGKSYEKLNEKTGINLLDKEWLRSRAYENIKVINGEKMKKWKKMYEDYRIELTGDIAMYPTFGFGTDPVKGVTNSPVKEGGKVFLPLAGIFSNEPSPGQDENVEYSWADQITGDFSQDIDLEFIQAPRMELVARKDIEKNEDLTWCYFYDEDHRGYEVADVCKSEPEDIADRSKPVNPTLARFMLLALIFDVDGRLELFKKDENVLNFDSERMGNDYRVLGTRKTLSKNMVSVVKPMVTPIGYTFA
jgi:hypothetical protein